jgi:hypothetical protein
MNLTYLKNSDDPGELELEAAVDIDARGQEKDRETKRQSDSWAMRQLAPAFKAAPGVAFSLR